LGALVRPRMVETAPGLVRLRLDARDLDLDRRHARRRIRERLPQLDFGRAEPAQLLSEAAGARASGVDARAYRRLETRGRLAFRGGGAFRRGRELAPQHALCLAELTQCRAETGGPVGSGLAPRAQRRLDDVDRPVERVERSLESAGRREQRLQRPGAGPPDA